MSENARHALGALAEQSTVPKIRGSWRGPFPPRGTPFRSGARACRAVGSTGAVMPKTKWLLSKMCALVRTFSFPTGRVLLTAFAYFEYSDHLGRVLLTAFAYFEYSDHLRSFYNTPARWSRRYCSLRGGAAPRDIIQQYLQQQTRPED
jgi:hypothetical protein